MANGSMIKPRTGVPGQTPTSHLGRPSLYSEAVAQRLEDGLKSGMTLTAICQAEGMPDIMTVKGWKRRMPDFGTRLAHARQAGADFLVEDALDRLKNATPGKDGSISVDREVAAHQRWMAARMSPQDWGDKQQVQVSGGVTVQHVTAPDWIRDVVGLSAPSAAPIPGPGNGQGSVIDIEPATGDPDDQGDGAEEEGIDAIPAAFVR